MPQAGRRAFGVGGVEDVGPATQRQIDGVAAAARAGAGADRGDIDAAVVLKQKRTAR